MLFLVHSYRTTRERGRKSGNEWNPPKKIDLKPTSEVNGNNIILL